ncbi:hypothetical protein GIB67_024024, partial [Kingdonia uniflora]
MLSSSLLSDRHREEGKYIPNSSSSSPKTCISSSSTYRHEIASESTSIIIRFENKTSVNQLRIEIQWALREFSLRQETNAKGESRGGEGESEED